MASLAKSKHASPSPGRLSCSICLEVVESHGEDRSVAKLKCGHQFHLDCIGSAFNAKGAMQCPNCRQIEQGQWLYASGCFPQHSLPGNTGSEDDSDNHVGIHLNLFYLHDERGFLMKDDLVLVSSDKRWTNVEILSHLTP